MHTFFSLIGLLVVLLSFINLLRMTFLLIGADLYTVMLHRKTKKMREKTKNVYPTFSVIIPAYNEGKSIIKTVSSVLENGYPQDKFEVIVIDDGSTDNTAKYVQMYKEKHALDNLYVFSQTNRGKAQALNTGIQDYAKGALVMCLDADSYLAKGAIKKAADHFTDPQVFALAANVKIAKANGLLNLLQRFEYTVCYQMKRGQTFYNIEYIIGGIGSTFRRSFLQLIDYYDTNTVTEDIDLTMKMLRHGNKVIRVMYAADVIAYTQSVLTVADLIRQRYRWKWGRYQTFWKNKSMFFTRNEAFTKGLTWFYLPYALFGDIAFFFEPIVIGYIILLASVFHDFFTILSAMSVITFYLGMNILAEDSLPFFEKVKMIILAPFMYFLFYILSYIEYVALLKSWIMMHTLKNSLSTNRHVWQPVEREGYSVSGTTFGTNI